MRPRRLLPALILCLGGGVGLLVATAPQPLPFARTSRDATPHPVGPAPTAPVATPSQPAPIAAASSQVATTLVVVRWKRDGVELVDAVVKPGLPWVPGRGEGRFVISDADSGARLGEGPCGLPRLCDCERGADHTRGDVMVRHTAVVRLKLPRLAARQRVQLETPGPSGWEPVGTILVEDRS